MNMSLLRRAAALALLALIAAVVRHERTKPSGPHVPAKPVDVASVVAGCNALGDCESACARDQATACVSAGHFHEFGRGVPADPERALSLYQKACDLKYAGGCYNAAFLLASGKGNVAKDPTRARELYAEVCDLGSKTACEKAVALR